MMSRRAWAQLAAAAGLLLLPLLLYVSNERRRYGDVALYSSSLLLPAPPAQASDFRFTDARGWYQRFEAWFYKPLRIRIPSKVCLPRFF